MDPVKPKMLTRFLEAHAHERFLKGFEDLLAPLYAISRAGRYPLSSLDEIDQDALIDAIARSTGSVVSSLIPVSSYRPVLDAAWIAEDDYVTHFANSVFLNRKDVLHDHLGPDMVTDIVVAMHNAFLEPFLEVFFREQQVLTNLLEWRLFQAFWSMPSLAVFYLIGYAVAGDDKGFDDMAAIVRFLPQVVPLGEIWEKDEAWLVLVR